MGDKIDIIKIEYLDYRDTFQDGKELYQIDLYNETKNEHYRTFIECDKLITLLKESKGE